MTSDIADDDPFAGLMRPDLDAKKRREKELLTEVFHITQSEMPKWFLPTAKKLHLPAWQDFKRLDKSVEELASFVTEKKLMTIWECYAAVNRCHGSLKLVARIKKMIKRARDYIPSRPLETLVGLEEKADGIGQLVAEFLDVYVDIRKGRRSAEAYNWRSFEQVFVLYRNELRQAQRKAPEASLKTKNGFDAGAHGSRLVAYTAYLEFERDDVAWERRYGSILAFTSWVYGLENLTLLKETERFFVPQSPFPDAEKDFEQARQYRLRARDTVRHRARRRKSQ